MSTIADIITGGANVASGGLLGLAGRLIDRVIPDPTARDAAKLELFRAQESGDLQRLQMSYSAAADQVEVNKIEAGSGSNFRGGWRPAVGWTCAGGLGYQVLFRPMLEWVGTNLAHWQPPPSIDLETLLTILFGLLGIGGLRTMEKIKGVA